MYKRVTSIVISFHLLFITILLFNPKQLPAKKTKHVKVRTVHSMATIQPPPRPVAAVAQKTQEPPQKSSPRPTPALKKDTAPKKLAQKPTNKPAIVEKGKPTKKEEPPKRLEPPEKIWSEIDQALAKIEKKSYPVAKQPIQVPRPVTFLDFERSELDESDAVSNLMGFLRETLRLPEVGEVKMEIMVKKDGTIGKVVVLRSESQKNKLYLQEHLPLLQLPMQLDQDKTWVVTFCNEI